MFKSSQRGFTLIELVVVIVILGILAAFAVPRFARLDGQARAASVRALEGSIRSGSVLARSLWLAAGTNPANVTMENSQVAMVGGYPSRDGIDNTLAQGSVVPANNTTAGRYRLTTTDATTVQFRLNGATNPLTCFVQYAEAPANGNGAPNIITNVAGC